MKTKYLIGICVFMAGFVAGQYSILLKPVIVEFISNIIQGTIN